MSGFHLRLLGLFIILLLFMFPQNSTLGQSHHESTSAHPVTNSSTALTDSSPDFSIAANPSAVDLTHIPNALVNLTVTSINGFQGNITLDTEFAPGGGLLVWWVHTGRVVSLLPGGSVNATILINTPSNRSLLFRGERVIWVSAGASPCLNHIVTIPITVGPLSGSDFTLSADPPSLTVPAGDYLHNSTITVSSVNRFNGTVSFQWLGGVLTPESVILPAGGTASAQLSVPMPTTACIGIYFSLVIASGGSLSHAVLISERLTDPTVSTIYFYPSGFCCRPANSTFTVEVRVNVPPGEAINAFDVRINYTNPWTPLTHGVVQVENLNYSSSLFQQGIVIADCIDGQSQISLPECSQDDSSTPGQIHLSMMLLGTEVTGPVDGTIFRFTFKVAGNGTSTFIFDRALLVNPRLNASNRGLQDPAYVPVIEGMAAFSNQGMAAILDYQPAQPLGSSALRATQPVIFSAAGSFSADNPNLPIQSYSWNFGDGTSAFATRAVTDHVYNSPGLYTVSVKVADNTGQTGELTREVIVSPELGSLTLTVKDQSGAIQAGNVRVALYNDSYQSTPFSVQNTDQYGRAEFDNLTPGTYMATFTGPAIVTSSRTETIFPGWTTQATVYVSISLPPRVTINSITPNPADTGTPVTLTFTLTSPTSLLGISVDWGDGTVSHPSPTATSAVHSYRTTGNLKSQPITINVTATNTAGQGSATISARILDRPPVLILNNLSPIHAGTGQTVTISFSAADPDGTVSSFTVDWGDGSAPNILSALATSDTQSYTRAGSFTITITAKDDSGSSSHVSTSPVAVTAPAPTILGLAPIEFYSLIGIIAALITTATVLAFRRVRKI